jgi:hypothetical protein
MWRIDSYAISKGLNSAAGTGQSGIGQRLSVGVSLWSRGGLSYNTN